MSGEITLATPPRRSTARPGGSAPVTAGTVLTRQALNRATLARQLLLERATMPVEAALRHLVGLQAQSPQAPYVGLWSRLDGFDPDVLSQLIVDRRAVRIALMRGTVHLVTAGDALGLRPLVQPIYDRDLRLNPLHAPALRGLDLDALAAAGRELLAAAPLPNTELGAALARRWPDRAPTSLAYGVRNLLPLVQVPPRGLWRRAGQPVLTTAEAWLGRPLRAMDAATMVTRYLGAFGPATVADVQTWSGLTGLGEVVRRLPLVRFRDEQGRELVDLPEAPRPDPDTPAPVRFLADFDNLLVSHADRTRFVSDEHRAVMARHRYSRAVLVDGMVAGVWTATRQRRTATLRIRLLARISARRRTELTEEGDRLLGFVEPAAATRAVLVEGP